MPSFFDALLTGVTNTFSWPGILIPIMGTFLAMAISFLPGIGSASLMALMLVLTVSWSPESVLLLFGALVGGATFMGSVTAILFNIPGSAPSAAALLDGYPLGQKGYPRMAISCAATASAVGSLVGVIVLIALLPVLRPLIAELGPLERVLLGIWGLTTIISLPYSSKSKAATMCLLGLLLSMVGSDPVSGLARWTFGSNQMLHGLGTIPALLGFFTLAEIIGWGNQKFNQRVTVRPNQPADSVRSGINAVFKHRWLTIRSSIIGTLVGMVPGVGGTVAGFVAYGHATQTADDTTQFGKGDIRGLIAPEAAIDAKDGGSLLPAVALGLPGSEAGVFLVAVLLLHGLVPGTPMLTSQLPLTFTLIIALLFSNLLTSVIGVLLAPWLAKLSNFPLERIALPALVVSLVLIVQLNGQIFDLITAVVFGIAGYFFKLHNWPRVPFVIAFLLGNFIERNLALSARLIELDRIQPLQRPAALVIFLLILISVFWMYRKTKPEAETEALGAVDTWIAAPLTAVCLVFCVSAVFANYSTITVVTSIVALLAWIVVTAKSYVGAWPSADPGIHHQSADSSTQTIAISSSPNLHLYLLLAFPLAIYLLGFFVSLAGLVFCWLLRQRETSWRNGLSALLLAVASAGISYFLLIEVWNVILPTAWLAQLLY